MIDCEELALYAITNVLAYVEDTRLSSSLMCLLRVSHGVEVWKHLNQGCHCMVIPLQWKKR